MFCILYELFIKLEFLILPIMFYTNQYDGKYKLIGYLMSIKQGEIKKSLHQNDLTFFYVYKIKESVVNHANQRYYGQKESTMKWVII